MSPARATPATLSPLLVELAEALHITAVPADEIEELLERIAATFGLEVEVALFQSYAMVEVRDPSGGEVALRRMSFDTHWRLVQLDRVMELARALGSGALGLDEGKARLAALRPFHSPYARPLVVVAYGVYSAAVAARVGGRGVEMAVGAAVGLLAGWIHFGTVAHRRLDLVKSFLGGLAGGALTLLFAALLPPFGFAHALFGGVTLLVPAMVVTIAIHELANDALESGVLRLTYGMLRFLMLGFGLGIALGAAQLFGFALPHHDPEPLPLWATLLILIAGGLALVPCLQARRRDVPWIVLATLVAYGIQALCQRLLGDHGAPLVAAFGIGAVAQLHGRIPGHYASTVLVPGLLQLAPGFLGTRAVLHLLHTAGGGGDDTFVRVLLVALQLTGGLLLAELLLGQGKLGWGTPRQAGGEPR